MALHKEKLFTYKMKWAAFGVKTLNTNRTNMTNILSRTPNIPMQLLTLLCLAVLSTNLHGKDLDLTALQSEYRSELAKTKEGGYRTLTGEILGAEAAISEAVAKRGAALPQSNSDPDGKEASRPWRMHHRDAHDKYIQAIAALQTAQNEKLPALSRDGNRDMWFGGTYRVFVEGSSWAGIEMTKDASEDMAWRKGRSMEFERVMKSYGLDVMTVAGAPFHWSTIEPVKGGYDFSVSDYYLTELEKLGIYTDVNIFPEGRSGGKDLPDWFKEDYQGQFEFIYADGSIGLSHNMSIIPVSEKYTIDMPWVSDMKSFAREAGRNVKKHSNILFVISSPEQMFWGRSYPYTQAFTDGFRIWLEEKYEEIHNLNHRWGSTYTTFDEVEAPRFSNRRSMRAFEWEKETGIKNSAPAVYDFVTFTEDAMCAYEADKKSWIDEGSEQAADLLGGKGPDMYFLPRAGFARSGLNLWKTKGNDRGYSNCDLYSVEPADWALNVDMVTSINGHGAFAIEFNRSDRGLAPNWHLFRGMNDWEYRTCIWTGIAHGLKGGYFWELLRLKPLKWGIDYAAIDEDFLPLDIGMEIIRSNRQTALLSEVMSKALVPREQVAFYFPHETFNQRFNFKDEYAWAVEMSGLHELLIRSGYAPYFLSDENIEEVYNYPVVIVPNAPMIPEKSNQVLTEFTARGGHLVAFGMPARVDELMRPVDGRPLRDVFSTEMTPSNRTAGSLELSGISLSLPETYTFTPEALGKKRTAVESKSFVQSDTYAPFNLELKPTSGKTYGTWLDGTPAVVKSDYVSGTSIITGFLPGQKYLVANEAERENMQHWLRELMGVTPPITGNNQHIMSHVLKNKNGYFLVLVNLSDDSQSTSLSLNFLKETDTPVVEFPDGNVRYDLLRQLPGVWEEHQISVTLEPHMPAVYLFQNQPGQ
jgi:hypothetical protein